MSTPNKQYKVFNIAETNPTGAPDAGFLWIYPREGKLWIRNSTGTEYPLAGVSVTGAGPIPVWLPTIPEIYVGDYYLYEDLLYRATAESNSSSPKPPDTFVGTFWELVDLSDLAHVQNTDFKLGLHPLLIELNGPLIDFTSGAFATLFQNKNFFGIDPATPESEKPYSIKTGNNTQEFYVTYLGATGSIEFESDANQEIGDTPLILGPGDWAKFKGGFGSPFAAGKTQLLESSKSGDFIPISGTVEGRPVTGSVEFTPEIIGDLNAAIKIKGSNSLQMGLADDSTVYFLISDEVSNKSTSISNGGIYLINTLQNIVTNIIQLFNDYILIGIQTNQNSAFKGIVGVDYYGPNYDDNTYVQKKYVDDVILWEEVSTENDFRLPTEAEWSAEIATWATQNTAGAFGSDLKLPAAGYRDSLDGSFGSVDSDGLYWASDVSSTNARYLNFTSAFALMNPYARSIGYSVRLIKDGTFTVGTYVPESITIDGLPYETVFNETTGKVWLDRNLGATQVATSSADSASYGDLYQWGRYRDGHEKRDSLLHDGETLGLATVATPSLGNDWDGKFITVSTSPTDWLNPQNDLLWQGVDGINNPAPDSLLYARLKNDLKVKGDSLDLEEEAGLALDQTTPQTVENGKPIFSEGIEAPEIKTDGTTPTDLQITTGAAKTLELMTPVYADIDFPIIIRTVGTGRPVLTAISGNLTMPEWAVNDFNMCESQEFIHEWKEGSIVYWHIHLTTNGTNIDDRYVKFTLEYAYTEQGTWIFPAVVTTPDILIPANTPDKTQLIVSIANFTPADSKIGDHILAYLTRVASTGTAPTGDPWIPMLQLHVLKDTLGSRSIGTK